MRIKAPSAHLLFAALADPLRLRALSLLRDGEMCVGDLVTCLEVPQPTASRHLAALRAAGFVTTQKRGYWTFYALAGAGTAVHEKLLECIDCCQGEPAIEADLRRARRLRKEGGCCPR